MNKNPLRILIIEDSEDDTLLLLRHLKKNGLHPNYKRVETIDQLISYLENEEWDIIIADYHLPEFTATEALEIMKKIQPNTPFIIMSGAIGEELAVEAMKKGARDFITKGNWVRLIPVIEREVNESEVRKKSRSAEIELSKTEKRYQSVVETATDTIMTIDDKGKVLFINHSVYNTFGFTPEETRGKNLTFLIPAFFETINQSAIKRSFTIDNHLAWQPIEFIGQHQSGQIFPVEISIGEYLEHNQQIFTLIIRDVTERKRAESSIFKVNRALKTLSRCNEVLVRAQDENKLLHDVCQILVETGGYKLAWVGFINHEKKIVEQIAYKGLDEDYLQSVIIPIDDPKTTNPTSLAIQTGIPCGEQNFLLNSNNEDWRTEAIKRNFYSAISLPLLSENAVLGTITIYSSEANAFNVEEVNLLSELANDLAFGIMVLRGKNEQKKAEEALQESEEKFRKITSSAKDAIIMTNKKGDISYWNSAAQTIFGFSEKEVLGENIDLILNREIFINHDLYNSHSKKSEKNLLEKSVELLAYKKDHTQIPVELSLSQVNLQENLHFIGIIRDISERKIAEEEKKLGTIKLLKAMQETITAMSKTVEARDPYTAGHQQRVANLAVAIAKSLKMREHDIEGIYLAGLIHDIGKIHIPAEILSKPSVLTEIEFAFLKTHPQVGYEIVKNIEFPWPIAKMVHQHHERIDGSGYPHQLKENEILSQAKILAVADVVESMASHRPYRPALGIGKALEEISNNRNIFYDPDVVDACTKLFTELNYQFI